VRRKVIFTLVIFGSIGVASALVANWVRRMRSPGGFSGPGAAVIWEPTNYQHAEPVLERQPVLIRLHLRNRSTETIQVNAIKPSCSCMSVVFPKELANTKQTLAPQGRLAVPIRLDATNRFGSRRFSVVAECQVKGNTITVKSDIQVEVKAAPRAFPSAVYAHDRLPGERLEATVDIRDAYPDPGVAFSRVVTSNPQQLRAQLKRAREEHDPGREEGFQSRYTIDLTYTIPVDRDWCEEQIQVFSSDPAIPPLKIPVIVSCKRPRFLVSPRSITAFIPAQGEHPIRRTLECVSADGSAPNVVVTSLPPHTSVKLSGSQDGRQQLFVTLNVPPMASPFQAVLKLAAGPDQSEVIDVPIKVYRGTAPPEGEASSSRATRYDLRKSVHGSEQLRFAWCFHQDRRS
jgi:hypothetical protein